MLNIQILNNFAFLWINRIFTRVPTGNGQHTWNRLIWKEFIYKGINYKGNATREPQYTGESPRAANILTMTYPYAKEAVLLESRGRKSSREKSLERTRDFCWEGLSQPHSKESGDRKYPFSPLLPPSDLLPGPPTD